MVELVEIKEGTFFKEYKDIVKLCLKDGVMLPYLLDRLDVPVKYDFTDKERSNLKISEESSSKRQQMNMDFEEKLGAISFDGDLDKLSDELNTLYNEELLSFIAKYPKYQKILK